MRNFRNSKTGENYIIALSALYLRKYFMLDGRKRARVRVM